MSENPEQNGATSPSNEYLRRELPTPMTHAVVVEKVPSNLEVRSSTQALERTFHRTDVQQAPHRTLNRFAPSNLVPAELRRLPEATTKPPSDGMDMQRMCSYPVPGDHLPEHYTRVIEQLDRRHPVMAAILRDGLERIEKAKMDLNDLQEQLQTEHQRANEDAAKSARDLQQAIDAVENEIAKVNSDYIEKKREIFRRRSEYAQEYMAGQALAGIFPNPAEAFGPIARNDRPLITDNDDNIALEPSADVWPAASTLGQPQPVPVDTHQLVPDSSPLPPASSDGQLTLQSAAHEPQSLTPPVGGLQQSLNTQAEAPTIVHLPPGVPLEPEDPTKIELPLEEARQRVRSLQAIAADEGYLADGAATKLLGKGKETGFLKKFNSVWYPLVNALAMLVCGAVFAFSLGIITGLINADIFAIDPSRELAPFGGLLIVGTVLFYLMGRAITSFVAHAAELNQNTITAGISKDPLAFAKRIRWSAVWVLLVGMAGIGAVVVIEANVERHGIAHYFHDQLMGSLIAHGTIHPGSAITNLALWSIALMAGIPFVLFHASHAWVESRQEVITSHLTNLQHNEMYEIARQIQQERVEKAHQNAEIVQAAWKDAEARIEQEKQDAILREEHRRRDELAAWKEIMLARSDVQVTNDNNYLDEDHEDSADSNHSTPLEDEAPRYWQHDDSSLRPMGTVWESTKPELQQQIARSLVQLLSIKSELGIASTEHKLKLEPLKRRLDELMAQRVQETVGLSPEALRRLDDARMDYEHAVQRFDTYYYENADRIMKMFVGGMKSRLMGWWKQPPLDVE